MKKLTFEFWKLFFQTSGAWTLSPTIFRFLLVNDAPLGLLSGIKGKEPIDNQFYNKMQTQGTLVAPNRNKGDGNFSSRLRGAQKCELNVYSTCTNQERWLMQVAIKMVHGQTMCNKLSYDSPWLKIEKNSPFSL